MIARANLRGDVRAPWWRRLKYGHIRYGVQAGQSQGAAGTYIYTCTARALDEPVCEIYQL